mgnify:CR=1 FL=1
MKNEKFDFYNSTTIKSYNLDEKIRYQLKMLDSLDAFTRKHSENVASITCRLCEHLHLDKGFTIIVQHVRIFTISERFLSHQQFYKKLRS